MSKIIDLKGQTFSKLRVIERDFEYQSLLKSKKVYWKCLCQCGNTTTVYTDSLKRGKIKSCGCLSQEIYNEKGYNLVGKIFGRLTVIKRDLIYEKENKKRKALLEM